MQRLSARADRRQYWIPGQVSTYLDTKVRGLYPLRGRLYGDSRFPRFPPTGFQGLHGATGELRLSECLSFQEACAQEHPLQNGRHHCSFLFNTNTRDQLTWQEAPSRLRLRSNRYWAHGRPSYALSSRSSLDCAKQMPRW